MVGYKKYLLTLWDSESGIDDGPDYNSRGAAENGAKAFLGDGIEGVAIIDTQRNAVIKTYGQFPDLTEVFTPGMVIDGRRKNDKCSQKR